MLSQHATRFAVMFCFIIASLQAHYPDASLAPPHLCPSPKGEGKSACFEVKLRVRPVSRFNGRCVQQVLFLNIPRRSSDAGYGRVRYFTYRHEKELDSEALTQLPESPLTLVEARNKLEPRFATNYSTVFEASATFAGRLNAMSKKNFKNSIYSIASSDVFAELGNDIWPEI